MLQKTITRAVAAATRSPPVLCAINTAGHLMKILVQTTRGAFTGISRVTGAVSHFESVFFDLY